MDAFIEWKRQIQSQEKKVFLQNGEVGRCSLTVSTPVPNPPVGSEREAGM
jgi:hypothetical protein